MYNDVTCISCVYNKNGSFVKLCGLCEAKAIENRISWWQDGKKKLQKKIDIAEKISKTIHR